jgi:hypothetical protein
MNRQIDVLSKKDFRKNIKAYIGCVEQGMTVVVHLHNTKLKLSSSEEDFEKLDRMYAKALDDDRNGRTIIYTDDYFKNKLDAAKVYS